jgi:hypothetical protein
MKRWYDKDMVLCKKHGQKKNGMFLEHANFAKEYLAWEQKKKAFEREVLEEAKNIAKEGANSQAMENLIVLGNMSQIVKTLQMMLLQQS